MSTQSSFSLSYETVNFRKLAAEISLIKVFVYIRSAQPKFCGLQRLAGCFSRMGAANLAAELTGESPIGAILSLAP